MTGKLTDKFMDQLEQWIGKGPKKFELLYAITRDGCDATTFHQKCDGQGPTVTVLYNQQGTIYGGYTAVSWYQTKNYSNDAEAFLFRLQFSGTAVATKFPCKSQYSNHAIYCAVNYGPTFGGGHNLHTFSGTINISNGYFALNGYMIADDTFYDHQRFTKDQINNGSMNVTDLEVYKVTDGQRVQRNLPKPKKQEGPWRKTPEWSVESLEDLQSEVEKFSPPPAVQVVQSRILVIGPVGAGKSSFFNTVASVFRGRVTSQASCGSTEHSVTSQYRMYQVRSSSSSEPLKFRLCDTRGLEETQGVDANDVTYLLDGNVPDGYHFNPSLPISSEIQGFKKNTTLKDRIHCVCIVIDGSTAGVLPEKMLEKIKAIQSKIHIRGIPQIVLLTKVDKISESVATDTAEIFKNKAVQEQVEKVSQLFGVPINHVLPVRNYIREIEVDQDINILALLTLRQILRVTEDYMFNFLDDVQRDSDQVSGLTSID